MSPKLSAITARGIQEAPFFKEDLAKILVNLNFGTFKAKDLEDYQHAMIKHDIKAGESTDSDHRMTGSPQLSSDSYSEPDEQSIPRISHRSNKVKEMSNIMLYRNTPIKSDRIHEEVRRPSPPPVGRGRGVFSLSSLSSLQKLSTPLSSVGSSSSVDTAGAIGSPESKVSDDLFSNLLSSSRNPATSSVSEMPSIPNLLSSMDIVEIPDPERNVLQNGNCKSTLFKSSPLYVAPEENCTPVMPDNMQVSEIPSSATTNPSSVLTSRNICLPRGTYEIEEHKQHSSSTTSVSKDSVSTHSEKELVSAMEFVSPFEGLTSAAKSKAIKGITLVGSESSHSRKLSAAEHTDMFQSPPCLKNVTQSCLCPQDVTRSHLCPKDATRSHLCPKDATQFHLCPKDVTQTHLCPKNVTPSHLCPDSGNHRSLEKKEEIVSKGLLCCARVSSNFNSIKTKEIVISDQTDVQQSQIPPPTNSPASIALKTNYKVPQWVCKQLMQKLQDGNQREVNENGNGSNESDSFDVDSSQEQLPLKGKEESKTNECRALSSDSVPNKCKATLDGDTTCQGMSKRKQVLESQDAELMPKQLLCTPDKVQESKNSMGSMVDVRENPESELASKIDKSELQKCNKSREKLNASFMSDARDVWTDEKKLDIVEGEFSPLLKERDGVQGPNIAKLFRVYVGGGTISYEKVIINDVGLSLLNSHVSQTLRNAGMKATRLQAYTWPAICHGNSTIIVGDRYSGKTFGYMVPVVSTMVDCWQFITKRMVSGIGAVMVVMCNDWRRAKCAADSVVNLLPVLKPTLKVMTAWGGCGHEEADATKIHLLKGCDILITTPPCLVRLLTGVPTDQGREGVCQEMRETPATSLNRCCYFVVDDADLTLHNFPDEIKQLVKWWGEGQRDFDRQMVVTSSKWTPLIKSLVKNLYTILNPMVIISSPGEAAISAGVTTHVHHVLEEHEIACKVVRLIQDHSSNRKNLIFVKNDEEAKILKSFLQNATIFSICVANTIAMWELQNLVHQWHDMQAITMIVSESSVYQLLHHNLGNADVIFHPYMPKTVSKFMMRYAFMIDNFTTDLQNGVSDCKSHVILTENIVHSNPDLMVELCRLSKEMPKAFINVVPQERKKCSKYNALCYYLKAYGKCPERDYCRFRHEIKITDVTEGLPRIGEVTFSVVKLINASRFLIRLKGYREKAGTPKVSLEDHYFTLFLSLQRHYDDVLNHKSLNYAEVGMLCVVKDKTKWARAKVDSVDYSKHVTYIVVFLIDEGIEVTVELKSALVLHPKFSTTPGLIVEAYLCCVKPLDCDREWTQHASRYIHDIFTSPAKNTEFVGRIILALNFTLWLSPVVELVKVGRDVFQKGSLRSRLLTQGFGEDNPRHMEELKDQCVRSGISLEEQDLRSDVWLTKLNVAKDSFGNFNSVINHTNLKGDAPVSISSIESKSSTSGEVIKRNSHSKSKENVSPELMVENPSSKKPSTLTTGEHQLTVENSPQRLSILVKDEIKGAVCAEDLPLHVKLEVKIALVESYDWFFIQREDKLDSLDELEQDIASLTQSWGTLTEEMTSGGLPWNPAPDVPPATYCLAKFTDDSYYRGWVESDEPDESKRVFFIDYGETLTLPRNHVQPCPRNLLERMPAQSIPCCLAHVTVPSVLQREAVNTMNDLADSADIWMLKVNMTLTYNSKAPCVDPLYGSDGTQVSVLVEGAWPLDRKLFECLEAVGVKDTEDGKHYAVEIECGGNPPRQMWRELVSAGIAVHEVEDSQAHLASMQEDSRNKDYEVEENENGNTKEKTEPHKMSIESMESVDSLPISKQSRCTTLGDKFSSGAKGPLSKQQHVTEMKEAFKSYRKLEVSSREFHDMCLFVPPLQAVEGVTNKLNPETSWSQNDKLVILKIHLIGVQLYRCRIGSSRLIFMTLLGDKFYVIDEGLEGEIDADHSSIKVKGMSVVISLAKALKKAWENPFADKSNRRWLRAEFQGLASDDEDSSDDSEYYDPNCWKTSTKHHVSGMFGGLPAGLSDDDSSSGNFSEDEGINDFIS